MVSLRIELRKEFENKPEGTYAPYYYRYLGQREHMGEPVAVMRGYGIYSLFANTSPVIYKNDLIPGSTSGAFLDKEEYILNCVKDFVTRIGERTFITNKDHYAPNYDKLLSIGINGIMEEIDASLKKFSFDEKKSETLCAMKTAFSGFIRMIENHAKEAIRLCDNAEYNKDRLAFIASNCEALLSGKPQTFAQALQLVWLCHTAFLLEGRYAMALGAMDRYLYPFYKKDVEDGILTKETATELLENVFIKLASDNVVNICIGGTDPTGKCIINDLSYCILWAVKNCNIPGPNLSLRVTPDTPDDFLDEALKSIGTGLGYPALMNNDVNVAALKKYGYDHDDVHNHVMVGCIENFITGKQPPWSDGRFDTPAFFEYLFNDGISKFRHTVGYDTGDIHGITSMQEFMKRFEAQLDYGVREYCTFFNARNNSINQEYYAEPFLSCFCDDCIGRGLDINCGGSIYPSVHGVGIMGIGTICDSMAAIEKVVFMDKCATLQEVRDALNSNFEGYEDLHKKLLAAPKYGNNDDFVDKYAIWLVDCMSKLFLRHKTRDGGGIYISMASNVQNISAGKIIAATPDGRKQGEPLSDAASPTYGKDVNGVTSTLASVAKPDYTLVACGSVVNQKFSPSIFEDGTRGKLLALIKTYFAGGGQEIQINATSRKVLLDAMEHPESYKSLVVRVSGFSDYYTRLDKGIQLDILNRTQHS